MSKIYLVGSLRNANIPEIAEKLRGDGHDVFDDWHGAGPQADDYWKSYEEYRGRPYIEAVQGKAAQNICAFDKANILAAEVVVLVLPAGRSGHMEIGFAAGSGKRTYILLDDAYARWDVMYALTDKVCDSLPMLRAEIAIDGFVDDIAKEAGL